MISWINSAGGPLLVTTPAGLEHWQGVEGEDYGWACEAAGAPLSVLLRYGHPFLVLGDSPMQSTLVLNEDSFFIARWEYCSSEQAAANALSNIGTTVVLAEPVQICLERPFVALFDSATLGLDVAAQAPLFAVLPGSYVVSTEQYSDEVSFSFVIHQFTLRSFAG